MRIVCDKDILNDFFDNLKSRNSWTWEDLGRIANVTDRTLRDWCNGKHMGSFEKIKSLSEKGGVSFPFPAKLLPDHWYSSPNGKKGAVARYKKYGNPGTLEGRRKGGKNSAISLRKPITIPIKSESLAEFIGIVLGDGGITPHQLRVYLNRIDDKDYIGFVSRLIERLFGVQPSRCRRQQVEVLCVSRRNLIDFLLSVGMKIGNKVRQEVKIPDWIIKNAQYSYSCMRGLMDTDGSVFDEKHIYKKKIYSYQVLSFTSYSMPLLAQCQEIVKKLGINIVINDKRRFSIRRAKNIKEYLAHIGTNNFKHYKKLYSERENNVV